METVEKVDFWGRVVAAPGEFESLVTLDAAWNACAAVVWRVVGGSLVVNGPPLLVAAWEENLGLVPTEGDGLPARKAAILQRLCDMGLPVPAGLLESLLTRMLGEGKARVKHSGDTLTVSVALDTTEEQIEEVQKMLDRVLPRNLVTEFEQWPCDLTRVEYLESKGSQYIDTLVTQSNKFELDYSTITNIYTRFVMGVQIAGTKNIFGCGAADYVSPCDGMLRNAEVSSTTRHVLSYTMGHATKCFVDGEQKIARGVAANNPGDIVPEADLTMYLFGAHTGSGFWRGETLERIYGCKLWNEEGLLQGEFIPAIDNTGAPCMFDTVSKTPFYNSGADDFLYPGKETEATTYSLRNRMYAQMTEHGIRRLYRVPEGYSSKEEYAAANGFKLLIEPPQPEEGYWAPVWHEREDCIELEWVETEPPAEDLM